MSVGTSLFSHSIVNLKRLVKKWQFFNFFLPVVIVYSTSLLHIAITISQFKNLFYIFNNVLWNVDLFLTFFNLGNRLSAITSTQQKKCDWKDVLTIKHTSTQSWLTLYLLPPLCITRTDCAYKQLPHPSLFLLPLHSFLNVMFMFSQICLAVHWVTYSHIGVFISAFIEQGRRRGLIESRLHMHNFISRFFALLAHSVDTLIQMPLWTFPCFVLLLNCVILCCYIKLCYAVSCYYTIHIQYSHTVHILHSHTYFLVCHVKVFHLCQCVKGQECNNLSLNKMCGIILWTYQNKERMEN